jgi:UDP-glucose 4-epimerase
MKGKVLITGGLGYIGSHTVVELQNQGYETVIIDNLANSKAEVADRIIEITGKASDIYIADVRNKESLLKIFEEHPDLTSVIHFAADKAVGESVQKPLKYYSNNIGGLVNLLECMAEKGLGHIVFSSSCTVYGQPETVPVDEQTPIAQASSPYGNTKILSEEIIADMAHAEPVKAVCLRYFNPVGAHDSALIGELPLGIPNNLVPFITQTAAGLREKLTVFGSDYNTIDGTCVRDYIHVMDLAKAHVKALEYIDKQVGGVSYFNIGTGSGKTVLEVIQSFEKVAGIKLAYQLGDRREGDVEEIWANTEFAKNELQWSATRDLENMMKTAWAWQKYLSD